MNKSCRWILFFTVALAGCQSWPSHFEHPTPGAANAQPVNAFKAFAVYTNQEPRRAHFVPSGYMGDSDLSVSGAYVPTPAGKGPCLRARYLPKGSKRWSGLYWQDPANNWGTVPGKAGYDLRGATQVVFWARGENGGEKIQTFRVGGIVGRYPDSDEASIGPVILSKDWQMYSIDLKKKDLRHVIGGFGFSITRADNPEGATFYLDDIFYTGPDGVFPSSASFNRGGENSAVSSATAVAVSTAPVTPKVSLPDIKVQQEAAGLRVNFSSNLHFASGRALILPGSERVLDEFVALLNAYPDNKVSIEGHTDNSGNQSYNLELSRLRAQAVRDYLIKKGGFDAKRFSIVGYGSTRPVATNDTAAGRSLNRRVEVIILKAANHK